MLFAAEDALRDQEVPRLEASAIRLVHGSLHDLEEERSRPELPYRIGWGLERKRALLDAERSRTAIQP
ncbi:MAG: hypothetical protein F4228_03385 [Acidobacteria bacterium]|nr:hypothetical protein [Acidobacteriota bacterium]MYF13726.1 hypothetical protein [Acidobacteriota bacterium]MYI97290.1 hypothetical protein [Acidobacteriota bacterium]